MLRERATPAAPRDGERGEEVEEHVARRRPGRRWGPASRGRRGGSPRSPCSRGRRRRGASRGTRRTSLPAFGLHRRCPHLVSGVGVAAAGRGAARGRAGAARRRGGGAVAAAARSGGGRRGRAAAAAWRPGAGLRGGLRLGAASAARAAGTSAPGASQARASSLRADERAERRARVVLRVLVDLVDRERASRGSAQRKTRLRMCRVRALELAGVLDGAGGAGLDAQAAEHALRLVDVELRDDALLRVRRVLLERDLDAADGAGALAGLAAGADGGVHLEEAAVARRQHVPHRQRRAVRVLDRHRAPQRGARA